MVTEEELILHLGKDKMEAQLVLFSDDTEYCFHICIHYSDILPSKIKLKIIITIVKCI